MIVGQLLDQWSNGMCQNLTQCDQDYFRAIITLKVKITDTVTKLGLTVLGYLSTIIKTMIKPNKWFNDKW